MESAPNKMVDHIPWLSLSGVWALSFYYADTPLSNVVLCVWRRIFDRPCPGCGLTRSFCAMSAGDWHVAFDHHWAGPILYLIMVWCILAWGGRTILNKPGWMAVRNWVLVGAWGLAGLLMAGQIVRVLPHWFPVEAL